MGSIRTAANGAPRPRKSMRAFVLGVAAHRAGKTASSCYRAQGGDAEGSCHVAQTS